MNEIHKLLNEWIAKIPFESEKTTITDRLDEFFEQYTKSVKAIPEKNWNDFFNSIEPNLYSRKKHLNLIKQLHKSLIEVLSDYLKGYPVDAFFDMQNIFIYKKHLPEGFTTYADCFKFEIPDKNTILYRVRKINKNEQQDMSNMNMFHIRYSKRELVGSQRYSINGHPILYLGGSVDVCIRELNLTNDEDTFVSKFEFDKSQPKSLFIDLRIPSTTSNVDNKKIMNNLIAFPLVAICSLRVKNTEANFKDEYIIPQLILQTVRGKNDSKKSTKTIDKIQDKIGSYDGIIYTSTKVNAAERERYCDGEFDNYAIPSKVFSPKEKDVEFCEKLCQQFKVSEPIPLKFTTEIEKSVLEKLVILNFEPVYPCKNVDLNKIGISPKIKN